MSEILIVGAGPTGLAFGCEMLRRGIPVRLIQDVDHLSSHSKALGVQARTLEMFEKMGVIEKALAYGRPHTLLQIHYLDKIANISLKELDSPYPLLLILSQARTEAILHERFQELGGKVEWKTRLVSLNNGEALLEHEDGRKETCKPSWIIGCDGAHSVVRHSLNLTFEGASFTEIFLITDVVVDTPIETPQVLFNRKGFAMIVPLPELDHGYRLVIPVEKAPEKNPTAKAYEEMIKERGWREAFSVKEISWASQFHIHRRMANRIRVGNAFIMGDAAHLHSPIGGQGMNTSVQDAFNLAWKLELVIKGAASENLLDTYQTERHSVAKKVLKGTTLGTNFLSFGRKWCPRFFFWLLKTVLKYKHQTIANAMSELAVNYRGSSIVGEPARDKNWSGIKPGERALDGKFSNGERLFDRLKSPRHVLLLFKEDPIIEKIKREYGEWIDVHIVDSESLRQKYNAEPDSLYLIRPDGYIGYRSRKFNADEVFAYLAGIIKPSSQRSKP